MKKWLKDNPFIDIAVLAVVVVLAIFGGCQVTAPSLLDPSLRVTRLEMEHELQFLLDKAEMRFKQMDREESFRRELLNHALVIGSAGSVNLLGLIPIAMTILGAGAVADNVRKRKIINGQLTRDVETAKKNHNPPG